MIETQFELETHPEIRRYKLFNNYTDDVHIVTMKNLDDAFGGDPVELLRIKNNKSIVWYIEEI